MQNFGATIFLVFFGLSTLAVYLAVRRGWIKPLTGAIFGTIINSMFFMMYSLAKGNLFLQAMVVGIILGVLFTALTVTIAQFFRNNPPAA